MSTESDSLDSLEKLSDANYELAINLFKLMSTENNNDFMSPISIFSALSIKIITIKKKQKLNSLNQYSFHSSGILYNGANGETSKLLNKFLKFDEISISEDEINDGFKQLFKKSISTKNANLQIANRVLVKKGNKILPNFITILKQSYSAEVKECDFEKKGKFITDRINQWIKSQTNNKIDKFFDSTLDRTTQLVIVNTVYFKG
jgi:serine protease inhibitor